MENTITIFTPTYNRVEEIKRLYETLCKQSDKDFVWLVVDDGSTDSTKDYFKEIISENVINIKYIFQENKGKYIAHNMGVLKTNTNYFCCVDSDDWMSENAVEVIKNEINHNRDINYYIFPRNNKYNIPEIKMDVMDIKYAYSKKIETTLVFKTNEIKKYLFPENHLEKFMSEEVIYIDFSKENKGKYINIPIVFGEYLDNGLTYNIYKNWIKNYDNTMILFHKRYKYLSKYTFKISIINKIKCIINCNIINILCKKNVFKNTPSKLLSIITYFPSAIFAIKKGTL